MTRKSTAIEIAALIPGWMIVLHLVLLLARPVGADLPKETEAKAADSLRELGGRVFLDLKSKQVTEVNLNRNKLVLDKHLKQVSRFARLTDLSLEETAIGDQGLAHLADLKQLEWLNLFKTKVTDEGLKSLGKIRSLTHLPMGGTGVTDKGLAHLVGLGRLEYLGLRATRITDAAIQDLEKLKGLTGLHLGQSGVTDKTVTRIAKADVLPKLKELWLHDTGITNVALEHLARMKGLQRLHLQRTKTTAAAVRKLREALPACDIYWESDSKAEK